MSASVTIGNAFRIVQVILVLGCYVGFIPAIVHARDKVDRYYLLGGIAILAGLSIGSYVHYGDRFNYGILFTVMGMILWGRSALLSRQRRRDTVARERKDGGESE